MAWTEQCKIAFRTNASVRIGMQKKKYGAVNKILRELSKESNIPRETLKRWYYEKYENNDDSVKNDTNRKEPENTQKNTENSSEFPELCIKCGMRKIEIQNRTKKPYPKSSRYYGLCPMCRKRTDEVEILCPKCNKTFRLKKNKMGG